MKTYYGISSIMKIPFYCPNHNKKIVIKYKNFIMNELKEKSEILLSKINLNNENLEENTTVKDVIIRPPKNQNF